MTSGTNQETHQDRKDPDHGVSDPSLPLRGAGEGGARLADTQRAVLKDLVTAQLTVLEAFERLIASTRPASEDLINQFSREFMLGCFRLYPVGQEMGRHSLNAMTEMAREFSAVLRSALGVVDRDDALGAAAGQGEPSQAKSATG